MNDKDLQQLLDGTAERLGVVGAQLAIYQGERLQEFVTGKRNLERGLPVTKDTLFQIGSTTKVFNAALILSLVDEGKLVLGAPVSEYLHDFRLADPLAQQTMTLRHLLSMSAGLDNGPYHDYGRGDDALGRYVEMLAGVPQVFSPGTAFGYSNASAVIAGHVAARVAGKSWEQLLQERLWAPLRLNHSALLAEEWLLHPVALGYRACESVEGVERVPVWSLPRSMGPSGALTGCSAGDLVRLARLFLDRGRSIDGNQVLSEASIDRMQQPQVRLPTRMFADEWCIGPYRKQWGNQTLYGHSGTNDGGSSTLLWCAQKNIAIAVVANVAAQGYPFADAVFDVVFPQLFEITKPAAPTPKIVTPLLVDLQPYVGRFEAYGMTQTLAVDGDTLKLTSTMIAAPHTNVTGCTLIPLGEDRFLPADRRVSGNRNWDMAFWGRDATGRATHLLQGVFPLRRTG